MTEAQAKDRSGRSSSVAPATETVPLPTHRSDVMPLPLDAAALSFDDASAAWDALVEYVNRFATAWAESPEPALHEYLPEGPSTLRHMVLIELVKIDLEERLHRGRARKSIEQYIAEFPELQGETGPPCDLVYEEYHARQIAGDGVSHDEYFQRFPNLADSLRRLFGMRSTRMLARPLEPALRMHEPGEQLEEFAILRKLGEGAFADVFLAWQKSMQRRVALKISARRSDEPQTLAQLDHTNIVRVYDQRLVDNGRSHLLYMEYLPGGNLQMVAARVRETPPARRNGQMLLDVVDESLEQQGETQPPSMLRLRVAGMSWTEVVCWLGAQLADALDYAHAHNTLHRDLKPANVLLTAEGVPKLVDFNIAYSSKVDGATPTSFFGGSVGYMAPEHLEAFSPHHERTPESLDGRSDLYALGLVLWELLSGHRPFDHETIEGPWAVSLEAIIAARRRGVSPEALAELPADVPDGVRETLLKCLEPDPARRFATAAELAHDLRLGLDPVVCDFRRGHARAWQRWACRHVILATVLAGVLPNLAVSVVNVSYDWFSIVAPRLPEGAHYVFLGTLVTLFKAGLYLIGMMVGLWFALPAVRPLLHTVGGESLRRFGRIDEGTRLPQLARRRALELPVLVVAVSIGAWALSAVLFPAWINRSVSVTPRDYVHFFVSHMLCGAIAGILAFFLVALVMVRVLYPRLLELGRPEPLRADRLAALETQRVLFARLAVGVPFLAAVALGLGDPGFQPGFAALAVLGFAMLGATSWLSRSLQVDLKALERIVTQSEA